MIDLKALADLASAGFTKTDIINMTKQTQQPQVQAPAQPIPQPAPPMPTSIEALISQGYRILPPEQPADISAQLNDLKNIIQLSNIQTAQNNMPQQESTEDILASIIEPPLPTLGNEPNGATFGRNK